MRPLTPFMPGARAMKPLVRRRFQVSFTSASTSAFVAVRLASDQPGGALHYRFGPEHSAPWRCSRASLSNIGARASALMPEVLRLLETAIAACPFMGSQVHAFFRVGGSKRAKPTSGRFSAARENGDPRRFARKREKIPCAGPLGFPSQPASLANVVSVSESLGRAEPTKALPTVTSGPPAEDLYR